MTVSTDLNRKQYAGNGVTTSFATSPVVFFDSTDLDVYVVTTATGAATLLTETTDYTVTGGAGSTGTVATTGLYGAPSASQTLVIVRNVPLTQESDFVQNDASDAEVVEDALDKLTMADQQLSARLDRSFTLADSDVSGASLTVPTPVASRLLAWNDDADGLVNVAASDLSAVVTTAFSESLLDDSTALEARQTLLLDKHGADIASAATVNLNNATGDLVDVTGTVTITAITLAEGVEKTVRFTGALTLTHGASLVLPGSANITTVAGDVAVFRGYASSVVRCVSYSPITRTGSGGLVHAVSPTLTTPNLVGTATNNDAAAGSVGEYISSTVAKASAVSLSTGTAKTVTSISLTAGDWDLSGFIGFDFAASTNLTAASGSFSTTTNTEGAESASTLLKYGASGLVPGSPMQHALPTVRVPLAATTTYYLVASASFTVDACTSYGTIAARRRR